MTAYSSGPMTLTQIAQDLLTALTRPTYTPRHRAEEAQR